MTSIHFENPDQFRLLTADEYEERFDIPRGASLPSLHIASGEDHNSPFSILVYDPQIRNGQLLPRRIYRCSFDKRTLSGMIAKAQESGLVSSGQVQKFNTALEGHRLELRANSRAFSSLILETVADNYQVMPHADYESPEFQAEVRRGIPRELTNFLFSPKIVQISSPARRDPSPEETEQDNPGFQELTEQYHGKHLTPNQERHLFSIYNGLKYQVKQGIYALARDEPLDISQFQDLCSLASQANSALVHANMALVVAMVKRTRLSNLDFSELVSEGNLALLRAIEGFDISRGFKFSTYACRAIKKAFSRAQIKQSRYRERFPVEFDPEMEKSTFFDDKRQARNSTLVDDLREVQHKDLAGLTDIEQTILDCRFPQDNRTPLTLEETGRIIGVTKERVRQIQNKALEKYKQALEKVEFAVR